MAYSKNYTVANIIKTLGFDPRIENGWYVVDITKLDNGYHSAQSAYQSKSLKDDDMIFLPFAEDVICIIPPDLYKAHQDHENDEELDPLYGFNGGDAIYEEKNGIRYLTGWKALPDWKPYVPPDPETTPSQLDKIEAQALYTALMTDTLLDTEVKEDV